MIIDSINQKFVQVFGHQKSMAFCSPGRINLIGEHTDYNGGFVFPGAIDKNIAVRIAQNNTNEINVYSINYDAAVNFILREDDLPESIWAKYVFGVCMEMKKAGVAVRGFNAVFFGDIPLGSGLSSSAAMNCVFAFALNQLFEGNLSKMELAKIGQQAEHNYGGVQCGIMDQFASLFGKKDHLMRLDCKTLEYEYYPFQPNGYKLLLLNSNVKHQLASSAYNQRRQSCESVVAALQKRYPEVSLLRDATLDMIAEVRAEVGEEAYKRAAYVLDENNRVMQTCQALIDNDYELVGRLMYETHNGLSKQYEVSCEEMDFLVEQAQACGVTGARMMGGGFGGCTINLVQENMAAHFIEQTSSAFQSKFGHTPPLYEVCVSDGSRQID